MHTKRKINLVSGILIVIMLASWLANFGWVRLAGTFMLIPLLHPMAFFIGNYLSAELFADHPKVRWMTVLSFITFLLPHLLIADVGDVGEAYVFFHWIENSTVAAITSSIGYAALVLHLTALIIQYVLVFLSRRKA